MKQLKCIMFSLLLMILHESSFADTAVQGFRCGLRGGYGLLDNKVRISRLNCVNCGDSSDVAGRGVIGSITVEWGNLVGNTDLYLSAEGSFNFATTKGKKSIQGTFLLGGAGEDFTTTVLFRRSVDLVGKMGILLRDSALPYIKLGPSMGHWTGSSVSNGLNASGNLTVKSMGFVVGVGVDFPIGDRLAAGLGYDYRYYKNFTHFLKDNPTQVPLRSVAITPSAHAIMFGLTYKMSAIDFTTTPPSKERKRKRYKKPRPET